MAWDVEHQMELIPATALRRVMTALAAVWEKSGTAYSAS